VRPIVLAFTLIAFAALAAEPETDGPLTPLGAERAGNAGGTIPAWTGGLTRPPPGSVAGHTEIDPFASDDVLFEITAANAAEHADRLSPGQRALLEKYPQTWRLPVYPSHRSAAYPPFVYDALRQNATNARVVLEGRGGVEGAAVTSPFPEPTRGVEVVWNHNLRWRGIGVRRVQGTAAVTTSGRYTLTLSEQDWGFPYGVPGTSAFKSRYPNVLLALKSKTLEPALLSGDGLLVWETIDQTNDPRKSWSYIRGLRRVVRLPYFGYELPALNSDGLRTVDDFELYNGPPNRFDWRLIGKRELYIPYNAYRLHAVTDPRDIVRSGHVNPEYLRYELHRVWVVEGVLKEGMRHVYSRRVLYVDEDSWQVAVAENYDLDGNLWRVNEAHALNYYNVPVLWSTLEVFHDLQQSRVLINGLDNGRHPYEFTSKRDPREFTPNALIYYLR
jgi:hypothetical protein